MDDAFDLVVVVYDREVGEARFVEFVKNERAENFFVIDKNHVLLGDHEFADFAGVETHDGGDAGAVVTTENVAGSALEDVDKVGKSFGGVFGGLGRLEWFDGGPMRAIFFELGVEPTNEFLHKILEHDNIIISLKELYEEIKRFFSGGGCYWGAGGGDIRCGNLCGH